ncbi:helix-turn-helix domain-containing protein [Streptomyces sp. NPDC102365]|uniref:helix-turn-helix domain-containing protein n=1 Tax=Streptomyces sp. NPDC102365 TaxID=3366162 RepID=UPI0037FDA12D
MSSKKLDVLLSLAGGKSQRATAAEVGVSRGTVSRWAREPRFVEELAGMRRLLAEGAPAEVLLSAADAIGGRLSAPMASDGPVVVSVPAGASARQRRRLMARGVAEALERGERGE